MRQAKHRQPPRNVKYQSIFNRFRNFTMVRRDAYIDNLDLVVKFLANRALDCGCIIECGTWRGGMAAGLMSVGGSNRMYHFFDSFRGLPEPGVEDGERARQWRQDVTGPRCFNNCTASRQEFMEVISRVDVPPSQVQVHEGFFEETFPHFNPPKISALRLDVDWYESTIQCLEKFWDALLPGALVLVDDYYDWEGCRKAVHTFLAHRKADAAICQTCIGKVCYLLKS